jgi:hypothetical protein
MSKAGWTKQDMNFGWISTIAIKRRENSVSIRRHIAGIVLACTKIKSPMVFPLESLLLLDHNLPSIKRSPMGTTCGPRLNQMLSMLNPMQQEAFIKSHQTVSPALVLQGPPGTGKTFALAVLVLSYLLVRHLRCLICTPSNNAGNAITEGVMTIWAKENTRLGLGQLRIVRWLTLTAEHCIIKTGRAVGIPESMASISMGSHIRAHALSLAEKYGDDKWLRLCQ